MTAVAAFDDVMAPGRLLRQDFRAPPRRDSISQTSIHG